MKIEQESAAPESRYHLVTFGCQMNKYDSEKLEGILTSSGMVSSAEAGDAGLILVNTCSVREKAENKVLSFIGRLAKHKKANPDLLIALGGCMATYNKKDIAKMAPSVDIVFGPDAIANLPDMVKRRRATGKRQFDIGFSDATVWDTPETFIRKSRVTAWVGIMKGCDNRCTYCVVPDARGGEVSRPPEKILEEIRGLADEGFKEVTLIGQNVNSYGKGLKAEMEFPELLKSVESVDGIERIRFMTSHPKDITDSLIEVIASSVKVSPYLHLPIQSGSNRILAAMKRGYTREEYLGKVAKIREAVKGVSISTDLMFGFPGETEDDYQDSIGVMEEVRFDSAYFFNYSSREGTPAARYDDQVDRAVSRDRIEKALTLNKRIIMEKNRAMLGRKVVVLCEDQYNVLTDVKTGKSPGSAVISGRTPGNHVVRFDGNINLVGQTVNVEITGDTGYDLTGELFG